MRSSLVASGQRDRFEEVTTRVWQKVVSTIWDGQLTPAMREQLQLPLPDGGMSAGGVQERAPAAYLTGALSAVPAIHKALGTTTVEQLRRQYPALVATMEVATAELVQGTATQVPAVWLADRQLNLRGRQREWTRAMQAQRQKRLRQALGLVRQSWVIRQGHRLAWGARQHCPRCTQ